MFNIYKNSIIYIYVNLEHIITDTHTHAYTRTHAHTHTHTHAQHTHTQTSRKCIHNVTIM